MAGRKGVPEKRSRPVAFPPAGPGGPRRAPAGPGGSGRARGPGGLGPAGLDLLGVEGAALAGDVAGLEVAGDEGLDDLPWVGYSLGLGGRQGVKR